MEIEASDNIDEHPGDKTRREKTLFLPISIGGKEEQISTSIDQRLRDLQF